jgi:hypothetical protein
MMTSGLVVALFVVLRRMFVTFGSLLVMLSGPFVVFGAFVLSHVGNRLVRVVTGVAKRGHRWQERRAGVPSK